jgi:hypothetical protein
MQQSAKLIEYRPAAKRAATLGSIREGYRRASPKPCPEPSNPFILGMLRSNCGSQSAVPDQPLGDPKIANFNGPEPDGAVA